MTSVDTKLIKPLCPDCLKRGIETETCFMATYNGKSIAVICNDCSERIKDKDNKKAEEELKKKIIDKKQRILRFTNIGSKYENSCFNNFDHTREGLNNCTIWAKRFKNKIINGGEKISLYIYGTTGNGKTELQACAYNELVNAGFNCLFTTLSKIFGVMHDYDNVKAYDVYDIIRNLDAFFIDDFGIESLDKKSKEWLFEFFDIIDKFEIPTFITSNFFNRDHFISSSANQSKDSINLQRIFSRMISKFVIIENKASDYRPIQFEARRKKYENEELSEF